MAPDRGDDTERPDPPRLDGKLQIPRPSFAVLPRRRVHALLDRATRHRVTLVCAPPGAGKTVACASWAALRPSRAIWLTVDPADRRDWFWSYVCARLGRARVAPAQTLQALEDAGPGGFPLRLLHAAEQRHQDPALTRSGWALAGLALDSAATRDEHRAAGLLWFALGCASLHRWDIVAAASALRHADRQLGACCDRPSRGAKAWPAGGRRCPRLGRRNC